ncbi:MAG TPA: hypothetical protein VHM70_04280 [Polyangiaceae bacterium]|jgi:opacity protein-like surface antigen|nr:hypothetical protein [Polyangiaceae bacterium]
MRGNRCLLGVASALCVFALSPILAAAESAPAADAQGSGAEATDAPVDPKASPDVQSQVGLGTEKEDVDDSTGANKSDAAQDDKSETPEEPTFGHAFQFGLRSNLTLGYQVMLRFDNSPPCGPPAAATAGANQEEKKVCGYGTPPALDLALSYALFDSLEPYVWFRLGLGEHEKTYTQASRWAGAGIRIYTRSDSQFKLYFEPAIAIEFEHGTADAPPTAKYDTDFVGHLHFGMQYDFLANLGAYFSVGPNVSFVRAIGTEFEGSLGLQLRGP